MSTFLRLLEVEPDQKGSALITAVELWRAGAEPDGVFRVEPSSFEAVPGSPFAYWVSERVRGLFLRHSALQSDNRAALSGASTNDNDRFLRAIWEVDPSGRVRHSAPNAKWLPLAKGGGFSWFYQDVHLLLAWKNDGEEVKEFTAARRDSKGWGRHWAAELHNASSYGRRGLTWSRRSNKGLSFRILPEGCVFGEKGPAVMVDGDSVQQLLTLLAILCSSSFLKLIELQMAFGSFEVGVVQRTPVPDVDDQYATKLASLVRRAWLLRRRRETSVLTSHAFVLPALLQGSRRGLATGAEEVRKRDQVVDDELLHIRSTISDIAGDLYGLSPEDKLQMLAEARRSPVAEHSEDEEEEGEFEGSSVESDLVALTESMLEWSLGVSAGHFDIRLATGELSPPLEPEPFDPLPVCSPAMLQGRDGLPATQPPARYPLELPPDGILVDDLGHSWDLVARIEIVLEIVSSERGHAWIAEAEAILGRDLRDWFRRSAFDVHLRHHSRSRRKAPIFWYLAPKSREFGIWLYSPAATHDTFYRIQSDYVVGSLNNVAVSL